MSAKPQSGASPITVKQVGMISLCIAIIGGVYGFSTGGPVRMIFAAVECLIVGFVVLYIGASFIELSRK
jgi:hypothetical protein